MKIKKTLSASALLRTGALLVLLTAGFISFQNCAAGFQPQANVATNASTGGGSGDTTNGGSGTQIGTTSPTPTATPGPKVSLSWVAPTTGQQTGYTIQLSTDGVKFTTIMQAAGTQTSATVTVPTAGTTYYFRIQATNSGGGSAFTPIVTAIVPVR